MLLLVGICKIYIIQCIELYIILCLMYLKFNSVVSGLYGINLRGNVKCLHWVSYFFTRLLSKMKVYTYIYPHTCLL